MLGTGEFASSASESRIPSCTSSSWTVGTYCRQIGSPGDLIRSTIAGEIRNSKFSAACLSAAMGPVCSSPKRAASASSDAMLFLRSSYCQVSTQLLGVDHQIVARRVVRWDGRGLPITSRLVESSRRLVIVTQRGLNNREPCAVRRKPGFDFVHQLSSDAAALPRAIDYDPVQVPRACCPRRRALRRGRYASARRAARRGGSG